MSILTKITNKNVDQKSQIWSKFFSKIEIQKLRKKFWSKVTNLVKKVNFFPRSKIVEIAQLEIIGQKSKFRLKIWLNSGQMWKFGSKSEFWPNITI